MQMGHSGKSVKSGKQVNTQSDRPCAIGQRCLAPLGNQIGNVQSGKSGSRAKTCQTLISLAACVYIKNNSNDNTNNTSI